MVHCEIQLAETVMLTSNRAAQHFDYSRPTLDPLPPMSNDSQLDYPGTELDALSAAVNYHRWIVDSFSPYLGGTVAEVGAGIGSISKLLLAAGTQRLLIFEPSQNMFPRLARELHDEPRAQAINSSFSPQHAARRRRLGGLHQRLGTHPGRPR